MNDVLIWLDSDSWIASEKQLGPPSLGPDGLVACRFRLLLNVKCKGEPSYEL
jgi:hypothetical protein